MDLDPTEALKRIRGHLHAADVLTDESSVSALTDTLEALRDAVRVLDESLTRGGPLPRQWTHDG